MTANVHAATVAKIGSKNYSSVKMALYAAKNGQTVKLVKSATYTIGEYDRSPFYDKKVTVNLNKKKLNIKGSCYIYQKSNVTFKILNKGSGFGKPDPFGKRCL